MKWSTLERAVAQVTGESRRTIRRYGFNLVPNESPALLPEYVECSRCEPRFGSAAQRQ